MNTIKILQAQICIPPDKPSVLQQLNYIFKEAKVRKADMIALPEMFCCPYEAAKFPLFAQPEDGDILKACTELSKQHKIYLSAGSVPELGKDGKVYNTAYVFDRNGEKIAKHRKMHLFDISIPGGQTFRESDTLSAGSDVTTFETEFGTMGLCVCYDFRFPELGRLMALKGAKLVLVPAAFNWTTGPAHWELTFRAQAMFNQFFAVGTSSALDTYASYHAWGHSIAVDPWGTVLAQMDEKAGFQIVEVDLSRTKQIRQQLPLLQHRRADVYTFAEKEL
jgi:predicted amidohydrolase